MTHRRAVSGSVRGQYEPLSDSTPASPTTTPGTPSTPTIPRSRASSTPVTPISSTARPPSGSPPPGTVSMWLQAWATSRNLLILVASTLLLGYLAAHQSKTQLSPKAAEDLEFALLNSIGSSLPWGLEQTVYDGFDARTASGDIIYEEVPPQWIDRPGFPWLFKTTPALIAEPATHADNFGAVLATFARYTLRWPRFTSHRPLLYLHPTAAEPATADLTVDDVQAALSLLRAFEWPMLATFSCGATAANPADQKHLRIFPAPPNFRLWPERVDNDFLLALRIPGLPFRAFGLKFPPNPDARAAAHTLHRLLAEVKKTLATETAHFHPADDVSAFARARGHAPDPARVAASRAADAAAEFGYTVLLARDWMVAIPRRAPGPAINGMGGGRAAPAEALLGLVSVASDEQRDWWGQVGYEEYLGQLGFAPLGPPPARASKAPEELRAGERLVLEMLYPATTATATSTATGAGTTEGGWATGEAGPEVPGAAVEAHELAPSPPLQKR